MEPLVAEQLRTGRLLRVLQAYAPSVPGFFLYYPSRAQRSAHFGSSSRRCELTAAQSPGKAKKAR